MSVAQHPELNRIYGDKIVTPPTLPIFMKHYARWVIFYRPIQLAKESHEWTEHLLQFMTDRNLPEKVTPEQLDQVMKDFATEWDKAHVQDRETILDLHVDEDYTLKEGQEPPRVAPPQGFEEVCMNFVREVIRYNPGGIVRYAERYFKALEINKVPKFLQRMAEKKVHLLPKRNATPEEHEAAQMFLASQLGEHYEEGKEMKREDAVKLLKKTLETATAEQKAAAAARRKEEEEDRARAAAEAAEKQAKIEEQLRARNIDIEAAANAELEAMRNKAAAKPKQDDEEEEVDVFTKLSKQPETAEADDIVNIVRRLSGSSSTMGSPNPDQSKRLSASSPTEEQIQSPTEPNVGSTRQAPEKEQTSAAAVPSTSTDSEAAAAAARREEIARKKAEKLAKLKAEQEAREAAAAAAAGLQ